MRKPLLVSKETNDLQAGDTVVKLDGKGKVLEMNLLAQRLPTLGCSGNHFRTKGGAQFCYTSGVKVQVVANEK
jgi:hypothetical protein